MAAAIGGQVEIAGALLIELDRHPPLRQETLVRNHHRFASPLLLDLLIQRSWAHRSRDVDGALQDARLAAVLAAREDFPAASSSERAEQRAAAWTHYGNALRIKGEIVAADRAMQQAATDLRLAGSASYQTRGFFLEVLGVLRRCQRDFESADTILGSAVLLYQRAADRSRAARALVSQTIAACYAGDPNRGLELLRYAGAMVDGERDHELAFYMAQAGIRCFLDAGKPRQALALYSMGRPLYALQDDPLVRLKIGWLEGQIMLALGELQPAILQLERTREAYLDLSMDLSSAVVSLELAEAYTRAGRLGPARSVVLETVPTFERLGVTRELLASLIVLAKLDEQERYVGVLRAAARELAVAVP